MQSILEKFYDGDVIPREAAIPKNPQYKQAGKKFEELETQLTEMLSQKEKALYEQVQLAFIERLSFEETHRFVYAFRLGARMAFAVMQED